MTALIKANPALPAAIAKLVALATPETFQELSGGVTSGFPIISYKGKVWRIRKGGEETLHVDEDQNALPTIDVVLVQANPQPSKIFYDSKYEEGSNESPRCFSNDGLKPDPGVQNPISKVCATCPNNVWGSRITDAGKKSRLCSDARRMAVVFANDLYENADDCMKLLLRVPPASLNPLKDYAEKVLAPKGIPFFGIVTRIGFDVQAAHPQFTFKPARFLNDEEAEAIVRLRGSEDIKRILAEAQEFPAAPAAEGGVIETSPAPATAVAGSTTAPSPAATTGAAGTAPKKAAMRPASDEEAGLDAATPAAPPPKKAAATPKPAPAAEPVEEGVAAAPPPKKKGGAKAAPAPTPAPVQAAAEEEEETAPAPTSAKQPANFDSLLDSILNG